MLMIMPDMFFYVIMKKEKKRIIKSNLMHPDLYKTAGTASHSIFIRIGFSRFWY